MAKHVGQTVTIWVLRVPQADNPVGLGVGGGCMVVHCAMATTCRGSPMPGALMAGVGRGV